MIICSGNITGSGSIVANGILTQDTTGGNAPGGGSGGGAIIVARVGTDATVTKTTNGGVGGTSVGYTNHGGSGGAGTIQTLQIKA